MKKTHCSPQFAVDLARADTEIKAGIGEERENKRLSHFEAGQFISLMRAQFPGMPDGMPKKIAKVWLPLVREVAMADKEMVVERAIYTAVLQHTRYELERLYAEPAISERVLEEMRSYQRPRS